MLAQEVRPRLERDLSAGKLLANAFQRRDRMRGRPAVVAVQHLSRLGQRAHYDDLLHARAKGSTPSFFSSTIDSRAIFRASSRCGALSISESGVFA